MKFSKNTLDIIKNCSQINPGIFFEKGKTIKTISSQKVVLMSVDIEDEITEEFGIYDLNTFLSAISMCQDPTLKLEGNNLKISGSAGDTEINYRVTDKSMLVVPPEKGIVINDPEVSIDLTKEQLNWILSSASAITAPNIAIASDGTEVYLYATDVANSSASIAKLNIGKGDGTVYDIIFKTENLRIFSGNYSLKISTKGVSHWKNNDVSLEYWIATEASTYSK